MPNNVAINGTKPGIRFSRRKDRAEQKNILLNSDPTRDYRATRTNYYNELFVSQLPPYRLWTGRLMLASDPLVRFAHHVRNAALMPAEVEVTGPNERINKWVQEQWNFLWDQHRVKLTRAKQFGWTPLQIIPKLQDGLLCIKSVKDFAPEDSRALTVNNKICGHRVKGCGDYGIGCLRRSYPAWYEKWMEGGAKKLLQLRMIKDAYIGDIFWYPPNMSITLPNGQSITWKDLMRECGENRLSGGAMTLPRFFDNQGHELTGYTPPQDISGGGQIFEWVDHCDEGILRGADIPVEVIKAADTGSGYSGRSIPFLVVLSTATQELTEIVQCVDEQVLRPYAWLNFGGNPDYQIKPKSLVESFSDDTQGSPMGGAAIGGQPSSAPPPQAPPAQGQPQQFSENEFEAVGRIRANQAGITAKLSPQEAITLGKAYMSTLLLGLSRVTQHQEVRTNDDAQAEAAKKLTEQLDEAIERANEPSHEYSCALFKLPGELAFEVRKLGDRIPSEDLAADGKELDPHVTIKFGLHTNDVDEVRQAVLGQAPVAIQLGKCSCFKAETYDVVKLEVESDALHALNKHVSESLKCTDTHPTYQPHVTIAYVKSGLGPYYAKRLNDLQGKVAVFDRLTFSNKTREHTAIPLTGDAQFNEGGTSLSGGTFQFTELEDIVEKLKDFIAKGVKAKLALAKQRVLGVKDVLATPSALAIEVEREIGLLRPVIEDNLAVGMYSGAIAGKLEVVKSLPESYLSTLNLGGTPPTPPTASIALFGGAPPPYVQFPALDTALRDLGGSPVMVGANYRDTAAKVRAGAFAVTGDLTEGAVQEVRDLVAKAMEHGETLEEFSEQVAEKLGDSGKLSEAHLETIFRTNIASATSDAREAAMKLPLVADAFPYRAYHCTHDDRTREHHRALESLGLNGTNIYRADDPTFIKFRPPWDYNDRCNWHGVTVEQAARKGVDEAVKWWERATTAAEIHHTSPYQWLSATAPVVLEHVTPPAFEPPPEFVRNE
jgi:SPP1 gp7 family putative phage head morphogenesis protein